MNILLFGATGSAGGSVLKTCLECSSVESVNVVSRRPLRETHPKLRVFIHHNYLNYTAAARAFEDVDACFFCIGKSVLSVRGEADYRRITRDYAIAAAHMLELQSPDATFHYISAQGAHRNSLTMWARVKGQTEDELMDYNDAVCWRPGAIGGEPADNAPLLYKIFRPCFRMLKPLKMIYVSGEDLGRAMLYATAAGMRHRIIANTEIRAMAERGSIRTSLAEHHAAPPASR